MLSDSITQGNWNGVYGSEGLNIIGDSTNYPAYAQVTPIANATWTWADSTTDVRALRRAFLSDRIAATWYGDFTINVNVTDGQVHQLALYCVDWDSTARAQLIEIRAADTNALLDSRSIASFNQGRYLVWNISGAVNIVVTRTSGANAVVSGLFFQSTGAPTPTPTHTSTHRRRLGS